MVLLVSLQSYRLRSENLRVLMTCEGVNIRQLLLKLYMIFYLSLIFMVLWFLAKKQQQNNQKNLYIFVFLHQNSLNQCLEHYVGS